MGLSSTAKDWFDDWISGNDRDDPVGFLMKLTLADSTVRWAQLFRSPGFRNMSGDEEVVPRLAFQSPFSISVLNNSLGQPDPETGRVLFDQFQIGTLQDGGFALYNQDGELNSWADDVWSDADGELMIGTLGQSDETTFETFYSFKVVGEPTWSMGGTRAHQLNFGIKSSGLNLNLAAQQTRFAGTGALEGTASAEGRPKPRVFGRLKHIVPFLVSPADERYMVSANVTDGIEDVEEAYEKGHPIGSGNFTETLASGYFDLANTAAYEPVTADVKGEKIDSGSYTADAGKIISYLIETLWGGSLDNGSVTAYSTDFTPAIGVYIDWQRGDTVSQVLNWALQPRGICFPEQDGTELYIQAIKKPEDQSASIAFEESQIASISTRQWVPPAFRVNVGYQERTRIDDPLPENPADREYLQKPRSYIKKEDLTVQTAYPNALDLEVPTPMYDETEAGTEGDTLLALLKVRRTVFDVALAGKMFHAWLGDYVSIKHADYPQISTAKNVLVTGYTFDLERKTVSLECWG